MIYFLLLESLYGVEMPIEHDWDEEGKEVDPYVHPSVALEGQPEIPISLAFHEIRYGIIGIILLEYFLASNITGIWVIPPWFPYIPWWWCPLHDSILPYYFHHLEETETSPCLPESNNTWSTMSSIQYSWIVGKCTSHYNVEHRIEVAFIVGRDDYDK